MRGSFHQRFLWRITGFPCELLESFALLDFAKRVEFFLRQYPLDAEPWPAFWYPLQGNPDLRDLEVHFREAFQMLRLKLRGLVRTERFQAAVTCSSPMAAARLSSAETENISVRLSKDKRLELLGMRYLQRFVTKCETMAFFGPVAIGSFDRVDSCIEYLYTPSMYQGVGYIGDRFLGLILRLLRNVPQILLAEWVRRRSGVALAENRIILHPRIGILSLGPLAYDLLSQASKTKRVKDLINSPFCKETEESLRTIRALLEIGLLSDELESVWHTPEPISFLNYVIQRAKEVPVVITELLDLLGKALYKWPVADSTSRRALLEVVQAVSKRLDIENIGNVGFYADHLPFVEDGFCQSTHLLIDRKWAQRFLQEIELVLREGLIADNVQVRALRQKLRTLPRFRNRSLVPLSEFFSEMATLGELEVPSVDESLKQSSYQLTGPVVVSPDVMIASANLDSLRRGECTWVLSECHNSIASASFFVRPMTDSTSWLSEISKFLASVMGPLRLVVTTSEVWNKTFYQAFIPCAKYLEVGLQAPQRANRICLDEISVKLDEEPELVLQNGKEPLVLLPYHQQTAPFLEPFRLPRYIPSHTNPNGRRVTRGNVVINRASWEMNGSQLPGKQASPWETFVWTQGERMKLDLPRWIFVHPSDERKPECIDLFNPFLCEELVRLLRRNRRLIVKEMFPSPDDAWVHGSDGRYLCELRLLYASKT